MSGLLSPLFFCSVDGFCGTATGEQQTGWSPDRPPVVFDQFSRRIIIASWWARADVGAGGRGPPAEIASAVPFMQRHSPARIRSTADRGGSEVTRRISTESTDVSAPWAPPPPERTKEQKPPRKLGTWTVEAYRTWKPRTCKFHASKGSILAFRRSTRRLPLAYHRRPFLVPRRQANRDQKKKKDRKRDAIDFRGPQLIRHLFSAQRRHRRQTTDEGRETRDERRQSPPSRPSPGVLSAECSGPLSGRVGAWHPGTFARSPARFSIGTDPFSPFKGSARKGKATRTPPPPA